jgi:hypothetical protein
MKYLKSLFLFFISISAFSQVIISEKIVLSSPDSANRHVTGIAYPESPSNAANASSLLNGQLIYGQASGTNQLVVNLNPPVSQYIQGMVVNFKTSGANTGATTLQLNNLSPVPVKKNGTFPLDSLDLAPDQLVTVIFDGNSFQVLSRLNRRCPSGFVDVNKDFCIELVERDTMTWFQATKVCGDMNGRLCTQSEWAFACQQTPLLNLVNMTDNLEWIDSAGNSSNQCKAMGVDQVGYSGCNAGYTQVCTVNKTFRCCYSK